MVSAREESDKVWLCVVLVLYCLGDEFVARLPPGKRPRFVGKGNFRDICYQGQPVSSSSTAKVVEPLSRGAIGLKQVLGMVCSAKESNAEVYKRFKIHA